MKVKKFFAREFLILIITAIIIGVLYLIQSFKTPTLKTDLNQINDEIDKKELVLNTVNDIPKNRPYALNIKSALEVRDPLGFLITNNAQDELLFYQKLSSTSFLDSIFEYFQENIDGFNKSKEEFHQLVSSSKEKLKEVILAPSEIKNLKLKTEKLKTEIETRKKEQENRKKNYSIAMFVILILIYPVRLLFYLVLKSIKTLKE